MEMFVKFAFPPGFPQYCFRVVHVKRMAAVGPPNKNRHPHEATILSSYVLKPLSHSEAINVLQRRLELILAVEDFERIVSYGARDSSERWWETEAIRLAMRARSKHVGVIAHALKLP